MFSLDQALLNLRSEWIGQQNSAAVSREEKCTCCPVMALINSTQSVIDFAPCTTSKASFQPISNIISRTVPADQTARGGYVHIIAVMSLFTHHAWSTWLPEKCVGETSTINVKEKNLQSKKTFICVNNAVKWQVAYCICDMSYSHIHFPCKV